MLQTTPHDDDEDNYNNDDMFQLQHHHLLACLERTTVHLTVTARVDGVTGDRFPLPVNTCRVDGRAFPLSELTSSVYTFTGAVIIIIIIIIYPWGKYPRG